MKTKNFVFFIAIFLVAVLVTFSACKKDDDSGNPDCDTYISATASGFLDQSFCFATLSSYDFVDGQSILLIANQEGDPIYSCTVQVGTGQHPYTGPGTYDCGNDEAGYVELIMHGTQNEFYKPESGTITVAEAGNSSFKATFNVTLKGLNNQETVTLSGSANY